MIVFDLRCSKGHEFEAWFRDSATYEKQIEESSISCAVCGDGKVGKALMAPAVSSGRPERTPEKAHAAAEAMRFLRKVQNHVEKNFDHVGERFPEEARKMHYGEADKRNIYGEASAGEAKALRDEGIQVGQIPWLPRQDG
jgi:hypothetical protein